MFGDKLMGGYAFVRRAASHGVVVVNANYRLAPEAAIADQVKDCKRAVAFVKRHAAEWGADPDAVFVSGESSGAHLAAMVALDSDPDAAPETSVAGCVSVSGQYDLTDPDGCIEQRFAPVFGDGATRWFFTRFVTQCKCESVEADADAVATASLEAASPLHVLRRMAQSLHGESRVRLVPPFFMVHGTLDEMAPLEYAERFFHELQRARATHGGGAGSKDAFAVCDGEHHGGAVVVPSPASFALGDAVVDFMRGVVGRGA